MNQDISGERMNQVLLVTRREVYGNVRLYPANEVARTFASIAGTVTLLPETIGHAKSLGYAVQYAIAGGTL